MSVPLFLLIFATYFLGEKEKALQVLREDGSNYSRFGRNMTELIDLIEKTNTSGKFKRKPVGPLGIMLSFSEINEG